MKKNVKRIVSLILALCMLSALAVTAFAAEAPATPGMYNVTVPDAKVYKADATEVTGAAANINGVDYTDFYADAERLLVKPTVGTGVHALIFALKQEDGEALVPTKDNIWYIDQKTAGADGLAEAFNVFPKTLEQGHYNIWMSTSDGKTAQNLGGFDYYQSYTLGDVDNNGVISANDALYALQVSVNVPEIGNGIPVTATTYMAADADLSGLVSANDALTILGISVGR